MFCSRVCFFRTLFLSQFKVLLFNDNGNTREYVSRSLVQVVGLPEDVAYKIMQQVSIKYEDTQSVAVCRASGAHYTMGFHVQYRSAR